jgi:SNF2 family DNA or RNA helicase
MVVAPVNTLANWAQEFKKWMPSAHRPEVTLLDSQSKGSSRLQQLGMWRRRGGVLIIGYEMYRNLVKAATHGKGFESGKESAAASAAAVDADSEDAGGGMDGPSKAAKAAKTMSLNDIRTLEALVNPGPDVIVADEAHTIKNFKVLPH